MKAIVVKKPGEVALCERPLPTPPAGFARIKVKAAAICATDLEVIDGNIPANYPLIPGHEWSGIVDAVGDPADKDWVGKAVIGSSDVVCLKCPACRSGNWRYCKEFEEIGFRRDGAYGEYFLAPVYGLCEKPDHVPFDTAALCEPLGVALGTLKKADAAFGQSLVIYGAGSIGLCMLAAAKAMGLGKTVVIATSTARLSVAKEMGADYTIATKEQDALAEVKRLFPDGVDLVVDATGIEECIQNSLKMARKGGTIALAGYGRGKQMSIRMDDIHINNLRVVGAGNNWNQHATALQLMAEGKVDLSPFISARLCREEFQTGLDLARNRPVGFVKALFIHE
ncbi:MAG: alcohol dehydrogenase catalytic domain-containing protein [Clostridia bacterium]|nr:alcohol dehydrogenase catalytic domain-containing protein [Clostridia bacterium]